MNDNHMKPVLGNVQKAVLTAYLHDPLHCQLSEQTRPASTLKRLQKKPGGLCASDRTAAPPDHHAASPPQLPGSVPRWGYSPVQCLMRTWPLFLKKNNIAALTLSFSIPLLPPNFFFHSRYYQ